MKISKKELFTILNKLKPAVEIGKNQLVEQSDCFIFNDDNIISYNDEIAILYPMKTGLKCPVPAKELLKFVTKSAGKDVVFEHKEEKLHLKSGKAKAVLNVSDIDATIFQLVETLEIPEKWLPAPEDFTKALSLCIHSVSSDITDEHLTCIDIRDNKMYSSDDLRISEFTMSSEIEKPFLLFGRHAEKLKDYKVIKYQVSDSWLYFLLEDDVIFCSRILVDQEFPDVSNYFDFDGESVELPSKLDESVDIAAIMSGIDDKMPAEIKVKIKNNVISCKGENEKGWTEKELKIDYPGSLQFSIHPEFFQRILSVTNKLKVGDDRALFVANEFRQLFSLMS